MPSCLDIPLYHVCFSMRLCVHERESVKEERSSHLHEKAVQVDVQDHHYREPSAMFVVAICFKI